MANTKIVEEARVEAEAEAALNTGLTGGLTNGPMNSLREAITAAEARPEATVFGSKIPVAEYRPRNAIPMKEVVMAKLSGMENELETSRKVRDQKRDEMLDKKRQVESLMLDIGRLGREIHDLDTMIFLDEISVRSLTRDYVSE